VPPTPAAARHSVPDDATSEDDKGDCNADDRCTGHSHGVLGVEVNENDAAMVEDTAGYVNINTKRRIMCHCGYKSRTWSSTVVTYHLQRQHSNAAVIVE
jgi:hypothetical protein